MENRERLKAATKSLHDGLEITIQAEKLLDQVEQQHYNALLYTHYRFINQVLQHSIVGIEFVLKEMKAKKEVLEEDLNYFSVFDLKANTSIEKPLNFTSDAEFIGWLYVAMGSQMGNRMMYSMLKKHDFFAGDNGLRYLGYRAEDSMANWKSLIAMINELNEEQYQQLEEGAKDAFHHFKKLWLTLKAELPTDV